MLKGITWLVDLWMKKEFLSELDSKSNAAPYEHGIAAYALAEAYSMTRYGTKRIPNLREAVLGSIDVIVKGQDSEGGWNYGYGAPSGGGPDMSVSGWQIQAMNTGHPGSMSTVHANSPKDALSRVEVMVGMGAAAFSEQATRALITSAVDIVVQLARLPDGKRRVVSPCLPESGQTRSSQVSTSGIS